eukprot:TRINITY_DN49185_c0_g1_i1.p1 TRINITY_DN49185_c0_g1~~TRINITY_DN49185_c0_g1_i1.p1  ORF type:complete len:372 (-),score=14.57 TRINITY_DN49185_c0_g1_i1:168-1283(-)
MFKHKLRIASCVRHQWFSTREGSSSLQFDKRAVSSGLTLQQLHRRYNRIYTLLKRLERPRIDGFSAFGEHIGLPFRYTCSDGSIVPSRQELEYMVGFFDGDGCVTKNGKGAKLSIGQSSDCGEAVLMFSRFFGGGIYRCGAGRGIRKETVQWEVGGIRMHSAALQLSSFPSVKRKQLAKAALLSMPAGSTIASNSSILSEPNISALLRRPLEGMSPSELSAALTRSKRDDVLEKELSCTWAYVAGFFDAEGCIMLPAASQAIRITFSQKHPAVLNVINDFFLSNGLTHAAQVRGNSHAHTLCISGRHARTILTKMLDSGLMLKRAAAQAAIQTSKHTHLQVRRSFPFFQVINPALRGWMMMVLLALLESRA